MVYVPRGRTRISSSLYVRFLLRFQPCMIQLDYCGRLYVPFQRIHGVLGRPPFPHCGVSRQYD